jgi:hypothetical protein
MPADGRDRLVEASGFDAPPLRGLVAQRRSHKVSVVA